MTVATAAGLPVELAARLQGNTEDELKADAEALKALIPQTAKPLPGGTRQTTTPVPDGLPAGETDAQRRKRLLGGGAEGVFSQGVVVTSDHNRAIRGNPMFRQLRRQAARRASAEAQINLSHRRAWFNTISTYSDITAYVNTIFNDSLFVARETGLMLNLVSILRAQGLAPRTIPLWSQAAVTEGAEGVDYSGTQTMDKSTAATITPKIAKTQYKFTQARYATDPDAVQAAAAREMGAAIAEHVDSDLVDLFSSFTSDQGTAGSALTLQRCANGMAVLRTNKTRGPYSYVLHPYGWQDIWTELGQPATNQALLGDVANQALRDYYVMRMVNADWYTDANISIDGSDDAVSAVFNRESIVFDERQAPIMLYDFDASVLGGGGHELNEEIWYGVGVQRAGYGVALTHDASAPTG